MGHNGSYKHGEDHVNFKHCGKNRYPKEYRVWLNIKFRCYNPKCKNYKYYGGRGILMDDAWKEDFLLFLNGVGRSPSPEHSLDRIENDKGYIPGNVRWALKDVQMRNTRHNHWISYNGQKMILSDWAIFFGVQPTNLLKSIKRHSFEYMYKYYSGEIDRVGKPKKHDALNNLP